MSILLINTLRFQDLQTEEERRGVGCGAGCPFPTGEGSGRGDAQNFFLILALKMAILGAFWALFLYLVIRKSVISRTKSTAKPAYKDL